MTRACLPHNATRCRTAAPGDFPDAPPLAIETSTLEVCLKEWRILRTYQRHLHIFGLFASRGKYWITPFVTVTNVGDAVRVSSPGVRYLLVGPPGKSAAASAFIECCAAFDARLLTTQDVTDEFLKKRQEAITMSAAANVEGIVARAGVIAQQD